MIQSNQVLTQHTYYTNSRGSFFNLSQKQGFKSGTACTLVLGASHTVSCYALKLTIYMLAQENTQWTNPKSHSASILRGNFEYCKKHTPHWLAVAWQQSISFCQYAWQKSIRNLLNLSSSCADMLHSIHWATRQTKRYKIEKAKKAHWWLL